MSMSGVDLPWAQQQLPSELEILKKILYRNHNQHSKTQIFRYLGKIKKTLALFLTSSAVDELDELGKRQQQKLKANCRDVNLAINVHHQQRNAVQASQLVIECCIKAGKGVRNQLRQGLFVPLMVLTLALISRILKISCIICLHFEDQSDITNNRLRTIMTTHPSLSDTIAEGLHSRYFGDSVDTKRVSIESVKEILKGNKLNISATATSELDEKSKVIIDDSDSSSSFYKRDTTASPFLEDDLNKNTPKSKKTTTNVNDERGNKEEEEKEEEEKDFHKDKHKELELEANGLKRGGLSGADKKEEEEEEDTVQIDMGTFMGSGLVQKKKKKKKKEEEHGDGHTKGLDNDSVNATIEIGIVVNIEKKKNNSKRRGEDQGSTNPKALKKKKLAKGCSNSSNKSKIDEHSKIKMKKKTELGDEIDDIFGSLF